MPSSRSGRSRDGNHYAIERLLFESKGRLSPQRALCIPIAEKLGVRFFNNWEGEDYSSNSNGRDARRLVETRDSLFEILENEILQSNVYRTNRILNRLSSLPANLRALNSPQTRPNSSPWPADLRVGTEELYSIV